MNISQLIEILPDSVKADIIDFTPVRLRTGERAERILLDRILTDSEKMELKKYKNIVGLECIASYRYAPEIQKSYFYIKHK